MKQSIRSLLFSLTMIVATPALAGENSISALLSSAKMDFNKVKSTEVGMIISSINSGTAFANLAFNHEFGDWFTGGIRAMLPLDFGRNTQTYVGQIYGRFPLLNTEDVIYIEPAVSQAFFSNDASTTPFWMMGASYAYFHRFGGDFTAGVNIGADYSPTRVASDKISTSTDAVYSHLTITGGYYF